MALEHVDLEGRMSRFAFGMVYQKMRLVGADVDGRGEVRLAEGLTLVLWRCRAEGFVVGSKAAQSRTVEDYRTIVWELDFCCFQDHLV